MASRARPIPAPSVSTCPASASRARLPERAAPTTSTTSTASVIANTAASRPRWAAAALWSWSCAMWSLCHRQPNGPGDRPGRQGRCASAPRRQPRGLVESLVQLTGGGRVEIDTPLPGHPALLPPDGEFLELHCPPPAAPDPNPPARVALAALSVAAHRQGVVSATQVTNRHAAGHRSLPEASRNGLGAGVTGSCRTSQPSRTATTGLTWVWVVAWETEALASSQT